MFFHNFKYTLKILLKNKMLIFWTLLFPIILGTLFYFAFMDIEKNERFSSIDIAIVNDSNFINNTYLKETFEVLGDNEVFNIKYTDIEEAKNLLDMETIVGYLMVENDIKVIVNQNGINETIFKNIVLEILENEKMVNILVQEKLKNNIENMDIQSIYEEITNKINQDNLNIQDITSKNLSYTMIEFYTLIAMTCLYGGLLGIFILKQIMPDMSSNGKRISISKLEKGKMLISGFLATYLVQLVSLLLLFLYTIFILKINYGNNIFLVILISLIGSLFGLSFGVFIGILKGSENFKTGILIALTMLFCFLSGMMGITMKYVIDKNIPIINKLNPVNMITDAFYSLYYYNTYDRYFLNLISLLIFSIVLITFSIKKLRRNVYDSI